MMINIFFTRRKLERLIHLVLLGRMKTKHKNDQDIYNELVKKHKDLISMMNAKNKHSTKKKIKQLVTPLDADKTTIS